MVPERREKVEIVKYLSTSLVQGARGVRREAVVEVEEGEEEEEVEVVREERDRIR